MLPIRPIKTLVVEWRNQFMAGNIAKIYCEALKDKKELRIHTGALHTACLKQLLDKISDGLVPVEETTAKKEFDRLFSGGPGGLGGLDLPKVPPLGERGLYDIGPGLLDDRGQIPNEKMNLSRDSSFPELDIISFVKSSRRNYGSFEIEPRQREAPSDFTKPPVYKRPQSRPAPHSNNGGSGGGSSHDHQ